MKFKFELDDIDTENFGELFYSERSRIISSMLEAIAEYKDNLPVQMRAYINAILNLDALAARVHPRFKMNSRELMQKHIDIYGENVYDADGNYRGYHIDGIFHPD